MTDSESNPVLTCMSAHRTYRDFKAEPVSDEAIARAVRAAQQAATSSWIQAYRLLQITRPEERDALARLASDQVQIRQAGAFFVICADTTRHRIVLADAPASDPPQAYAHNLEAFLTSSLDATLFAQNLVLAFESMGYGTCYIGAVRNDVAGVAKVLEFPQGIYPLFGLCVGTPASDPGQRPRLPLESVWNRDRVASDAQQREHIPAADSVSKDYYATRGQAQRSWSGGILRRFNHLEREALRGAYEALGASFD